MQMELLEFGRKMKKIMQNINCPGHHKMDKVWNQKLDIQC